MAMGAEVNGQLVHAEGQEPRMLGYDGAEPPAAPESTSSVDESNS
jgi:hypothetical protein